MEGVEAGVARVTPRSCQEDHVICRTVCNAGWRGCDWLGFDGGFGSPPLFFAFDSHFALMIMEGEERPRKQPKLNWDGETVDEGLGPAMTGAVDGVRDEEEKVDDHATTILTTNDGIDGADEDEESDADDATNEPAPEDEAGAPTMSKNQLKKLRRKEAWEASRGDRKAKKKEKIAAAKERKRNVLEEARKNGKEAEAEARKAYESTRQRHYQSTLVPLTFVMDCGFDELMMDKERISLASQLTRAYSDNGRSKYRVHYVISSFDKLLKERFDTALGKTYQNWKGVRTVPEDYVQVAEMAKEWMTEPQGGKMVGMFTDKTDAKPEDGEIVYLSSDSPDTLTELKPYSTYVIGGLVDKNRHKGICYKQATEKGVKTAKLPIGDYIQMASRSVLTTNHVMEIMLRWLETGDWAQAFMQVIPQRKGGQLKNPKDGAEEKEVDAEEAIVEGASSDGTPDAAAERSKEEEATINQE